MEAVLSRNAELAVTHAENHLVKPAQVILKNELPTDHNVERTINQLRRDIRAGFAAVPDK